MRLLSAALISCLLAGTYPAFAQRVGGDGQSQVYFWEDDRTYGWSDVIDARHSNPPPKVIKKAHVTIDEICARQVGRIMRFDQSSRIYSTQLEDACIRNGGKI